MNRQAFVMGVFTVGLVAGGALSAMVLWLASGLASPLPDGVRLGALIACAVAAAARDAGWLRVPLPQNARQIPQQVLQRHLARGTLRFGFELGTGVRTYVSASAPYVLALAVLLAAGEPWQAVLAGAGFGLGRAATPAMRLLSGDGAAWDARLAARLPLVKVGACLLLAATYGQALA